MPLHDSPCTWPQENCSCPAPDRTRQRPWPAGVPRADATVDRLCADLADSLSCEGSLVKHEPGTGMVVLHNSAGSFKFEVNRVTSL